MAQRALFLNSVLAAWLFCISCGAATNNVALKSWNADSLLLENRNGIMYTNNTPFSGKVFQLGTNNKDTLLIVAYYNGKEHDEWKRFYANGQLQELRYFDNGIKTKTLARWWQNGKQQFTCTFKDGEYEGVLQEWNANGQLIQQMHYVNGHEEGSQKMYYDNGKIRSNYIVKDGKRIGLLGTKNCVNASDSIFKK
ncbi:MAG: toxin-antitoxin system YwqK family antitoxin [Agriterribacter sp.]